MISLAAEGGYQVFHLNNEAWFWLIFSAATALLLKGRLLFRKGTVVTSLPYHLE